MQKEIFLIIKGYTSDGACVVEYITSCVDSLPVIEKFLLNEYNYVRQPALKVVRILMDIAVTPQ